MSVIPVVYIRTTVDQWSRNSSQKTQLYLYVQNFIRKIWKKKSTWKTRKSKKGQYLILQRERWKSGLDSCFGRFLTGHHQVGKQC